MKRRVGTAPVYVYLPVDDYRRLKALAARRGRPMTVLVGDLVLAWLDTQEAPREPPSQGGE